MGVVASNEAVVAQTDGWQDGEMRQVKVGETEVLLARVDGQFYATSATCTHYGAPLAKGLLHGTRLMCPWHHACFNITTGAKLEPPALDGLTSYPVRVEGQNIIVTNPLDGLQIAPAPAHEAHLQHDPRLFVILGGGAAGQAAAEILRQENFAGRIMLITREQRLPYDRPNLSKDYLAGKADPAWMPLRDDHFYAKHNIEVAYRNEVKEVDATNRLIKFEAGDTLHYDALLLATGSEPTKLEVPGADLEKVFTLRSYDDADNIIGAISGATDAVVVGASFIGMEVAASLIERGLKVTVVAPEDVPYTKVLGPEVGKMFQDLHTEKGVNFRLGHKLKQIEGTHRVEGVVLDDGQKIPADLVVVGLGVKPVTNYLYGVKVLDDNSVAVDGTLKAAEGLYAAGDIATFPDAQTDQPTRVEHWRVAQQHGHIAALAMLGQPEAYTGVPFFWTQQYKLSLRYVGFAKEWDEIIFWGDPAKRDFIGFYVKDNQVLAATGMKHDPEMDAIEELMRVGKMPGVPELRQQKVKLVELAQQS